MDFRRISLPPFAVPGDTLPERFLGAPAARAFFPRPLNRSRGNAMNSQVDQPAEVALENSHLHATLREVTLPAGFMRRMRQFVEQELELSE